MDFLSITQKPGALYSVNPNNVIDLWVNRRVSNVTEWLVFVSTFASYENGWDLITFPMLGQNSFPYKREWDKEVKSYSCFWYKVISRWLFSASILKKQKQCSLTFLPTRFGLCCPIYREYINVTTTWSFTGEYFLAFIKTTYRPILQVFHSTQQSNWMPNKASYISWRAGVKIGSIRWSLPLLKELCSEVSRGYVHSCVVLGCLGAGISWWRENVHFIEDFFFRHCYIDFCLKTFMCKRLCNYHIGQTCCEIKMVLST